MRLFVAVDLDEPRRLAASRAASDLTMRLMGLSRAIKWVQPQNLHLTLRFIGEVDAVRGARVQDALGRPLRTPAFDLGLGGIGVYPVAGTPRVLWIGVVEGASVLAQLHDEVEERLQAVGEPRESRPYSGHLTLARFKDLDRRAGDVVRGAIADLAVHAGTCRIEAVTLYDSRLAPSGPTYTPLLRAALSGART
jgi:2'-5' RNA ligase